MYKKCCITTPSVNNPSCYDTHNILVTNLLTKTELVVGEFKKYISSLFNQNFPIFHINLNESPMEEEYGIPGSNFQPYNHCENFNKKSSTFTKIGDHKAIIDRAKEFMKDFIEDLEIELSTPLLELLVDALLLLSDVSLFNVKCHTINTIPRLKLHLRALVVTLEIVVYSPTILARETCEQLFSNLDNFVDIHYHAAEMFNSFK
ncbi:11237_t:CDS:2, partial [Gigaspora rosea]